MTKPIVELTIEEAVENLKYLLECNYVDSFEETEKEAIKMGIEALKHYKEVQHENNKET